MIIYTGDFYLVYFICISNISDDIVAIIIYEGVVYIDFVLFIYVPNINDVRNGR